MVPVPLADIVPEGVPYPLAAIPGTTEKRKVLREQRTVMLVPPGWCLIFCFIRGEWEELGFPIDGPINVKIKLIRNL